MLANSGDGGFGEYGSDNNGDTVEVTTFFFPMPPHVPYGLRGLPLPVVAEV
jgi:hypothetical protein